MDPPKSDGQVADKGGEASVGFPRIEAWVESADPDLAGMDERLSLLKDLAQKGPDGKIKGGARKAGLAYERTLGLLRSLLETKAELSKTT